MNFKNGVILILLLAVAAVSLYAKSQQATLRERALSIDRLEAEADSAEQFFSDVLSDSSNVWERRIVQVELEADSLEQALRLRPVVRVRGQVRVDTLVVTDTVTVAEAEGDSVTTYRFGGEDGPFTIAGSGRIFQTGRGIFDVRVAQVADIPVSARIGCQEAAGVNRAFVALSAEDPFTIVPSETTQEPGVCNARMPVRFSLLPELSLRGVGWEIAKGIAFHLLWEFVEDQLESEASRSY